MICADCHGTGHVSEVYENEQGMGRVRLIPCGECGGSGITHCCDGLQEQPTQPHISSSDSQPPDADT